MMPWANSARSLVIGLIAGVVLALCLQTLLNSAQLPILVPDTIAPGSTATTVAATRTPFADMLKNSLQMARQGFGFGFGRVVLGDGAVAAGYKSARLAASSPGLSQHTSTPSSTTPSFTSTKHHYSTSSTMASQKSFLQAIQDRRTVYALNKEAPIKDSQITEIVKQVVLHVPSSFNSQSARLVVLLNEEHEKFWDAAAEILKAIVPAEQFAATEKKLTGFKAGYGTVLFFEDPAPVRALEKAWPIFAHHFPDWSEHTSAMHQYALWVALEAEGFGANLQHYNPIVDRKVQETWNVPVDWKLRAQLVFGGKAAEPGEKAFKPVEERLFVHGAKN